MTGLTRVGDVLAVAHELDEETTWERDGAPPELSPAVVTWLARLALHHPQVSAAVAAALPTSGLQWGMPWAGGDRDHVVRIRPDGTVIGEVYDESAERTGRTAMMEIDERLEAAGYTLLGEVYRRERVPCPCVVHGRPCETCMRCRGHGTVPVEEDPPPTPCPMCNGHGFTMDDPLYMCPRCSGRGTSPFRDLAAEAERDMPGGLLAAPSEPDEEPVQTGCPMCRDWVSVPPGGSARYSCACCGRTGYTRP